MGLVRRDHVVGLNAKARELIEHSEEACVERGRLFKCSLGYEHALLTYYFGASSPYGKMLREEVQDTSPHKKYFFLRLVDTYGNGIPGTEWSEAEMMRYIHDREQFFQRQRRRGLAPA